MSSRPADPGIAPERLTAALDRRRFLTMGAVGAGLAAVAPGLVPATALAGTAPQGVGSGGVGVAVAGSPAIHTAPPPPVGTIGRTTGLADWFVDQTPRFAPYPMGGVYGSGFVMARLPVGPGDVLSAVTVWSQTNSSMTWYLFDHDHQANATINLGTGSTSNTGVAVVNFLGLNFLVPQYHSVFVITNSATTASNLALATQSWYFPAQPQFYPINPTRVYDSRGSGGQLVEPGFRTVSVANATAFSGGTPNVVPMGAKAVTYNLTIVNTVGSGFLAVYPAGGSFGASAINWYANNQVVANGGTVSLGGDRQMVVLAGGGGGQTDFIVDVTGYFI